MLSIHMTTIASNTIPADSAAVRWMGRRAADNSGITIAFPGVETVLRFSGSSSVGMKGSVLSGQGWFNVYIDGIALPMLEIPQGDFDITLVSGLDAKAEHTLRLVRRSESWEGPVRMDAFTLEEGAKALPPTPLSQRKIMAIGDSITCGYNIEYTDAARPGNVNSNAELTYAWCLARDFDAQVNLVSYGGKGLMRDWRGMYTQMLVDAAAEGTLSNPRQIVSIPDLFERALPDVTDSRWDHSGYQPDIILICIGQNDYNSAFLGASDYAQAYVKFIERIHALHPQAPIVIMSSPMAERARTDGTQPRNAMHEAALSLVQQHFLRRGETFVTPFFMAKNDGTSLDAHPIAPQQRAMADELKPIVAKLTGWKAACCE